jgi:ABC-type multidrug transport system fused ATPase/permease subunit
MRMRQGDVNLVVVDEPSSAMDPAGEYELFKNLREGREGKTMIFITHRFGHLTKRADLILLASHAMNVISILTIFKHRCMKDGQLVESGTHSELIARKGTYHDLYDLQAQAFSD